MKILSARQQQRLDQATMDREPISSSDLMERAAKRCTGQILNYIEKDDRVGIVCGSGNNGGDGLVIARLLDEKGFDVSVYYVALSENGSDEFEQNRSRLKQTEVKWLEINSENDQVFKKENPDVFIDAIFGTGLSRPAEGLAKETINWINDNDQPVISVDVPSGLYCDQKNEDNDTVVHATLTFTFHAPKLSFFYPEQGKYVGEFLIIDIGLDAEASHSLSSCYEMITSDELIEMRNIRSRFSHKGTYGHVAIVAGSGKTMGAALLANEGALRVGTGLTTAFVPSTANQAFNVRLPVVMLENTGSEYCETILLREALTYGVGPGLGKNVKTKEALHTFLQNAKRPIVLDADALNIIAEAEWYDLIPQNSILTPHPKEFERLCSTFKNSYERTDLQIAFAKKHKVYVVLKDAYTAIACPDGTVYFNPFGSAGMATGGAGDVLTGMITGLLAQGYSPKHSAIFGVGLHGLAGMSASEELGEEYMSAEDILTHISNAYKVLD